MGQFVLVQRIKPPVFASGHGGIAEISAISNDALVFHTEVWGLRHPVFVGPKRVRAYEFFIESQVFEDFGKKFLTLFVIFRQHVKHNRILPAGNTVHRSFDGSVGRNIQRHIVSIDRIGDEPMVGRGAVCVFFGFA